MRWFKLPPLVAIFLICAEAPAKMDCDNKGKFWRMSGWFAVSVFLSKAPMETPPLLAPVAIILTFIKFRALMSTSSSGCSTSSFIRSSILVPPASTLALVLAVNSCVAAFKLVAPEYLNGFMVSSLVGELVSDRCISIACKLPGLCNLFAGM